MNRRIFYKRSVEKDFRKLSRNIAERKELEAEIEKKLTNNPAAGKELKGRYAGLRSLHIRYKLLVVYSILADGILILAIEPREKSYKGNY